MMFESYHILAVIYGLAAIISLGKGFANLRGKCLGKKATARVRTQDMAAWQRLQAFCNFLIGAVWLGLMFMTVATKGQLWSAGAQNLGLMRVMACAVGVGVLAIGIAVYASWRYAPKQGDEDF